MKITNEEYEEYKMLKKWAKREKVFKSAKDVKNLEDDIDTPIKNCVAMMALLGCKPMYSCCGFDYNGQLFHKSHQYGQPYIKMEACPRAIRFLEEFPRNRYWFADGGKYHIDLKVHANMSPYWRKEECIHFAEECVIAIGWLEQVLLSVNGVMADTISLEDSNQKALKENKYWQYPPKEPWVIKKDKILSSLAKT